MDLEKIVKEVVKEIVKEELFKKEEKVEEVNKLDSTAEIIQPTNTMM